MPRRPRPARQDTDEPQESAPPESRYRVEHYGESRNFAVYERKNLIAVTLYLKGANEITARLEERDLRIADLERQLVAVPQTPVSPALPSAEPTPAPTWSPPQQLALLAAEVMPTYRTTSPRRRPAHAPRRS
jgi:hypothetical protein